MASSPFMPGVQSQVSLAILELCTAFASCGHEWKQWKHWVLWCQTIILSPQHPFTALSSVRYIGKNASPIHLSFLPYSHTSWLYNQLLGFTHFCLTIPNLYHIQDLLSPWRLCLPCLRQALLTSRPWMQVMSQLVQCYLISNRDYRPHALKARRRGMPGRTDHGIICQTS